MNYKVYALASVLLTSTVLVGANAIASIAYAQNSLTIGTDKQQYVGGNIITVSGQTESGSIKTGQPVLIQVFNPVGVPYKFEQVSVAADGSFSDQLKIGGQIGISGQYRVMAYNDNVIKESRFDYISSEQTGNTVHVYNLNIGGKIYPIIYSVAGGKINSISADTDKAAILVDVSSISNGRLNMELPRSLIDVRNLQNNADSDYQVVADGQNSIFSEVGNNNHARLLSIDFPKGTQNIEIVGNKMPLESLTDGKIIQVATTVTGENVTAVTQGNKTVVTGGKSATISGTSPTDQTANNVASGTSSNGPATQADKNPANPTLTIAGKTYPVKYQITGGKVNGITADLAHASILANISTTTNGSITVQLPRNVIDSKKTPDNKTDTDFVVSEDGIATTAFNETANNATTRTLTIDFDKGVEQIEINGNQMLSHVVPEFGMLAPIILALGFMGILVVSTKYRKSSFF